MDKSNSLTQAMGSRIAEIRKASSFTQEQLANIMDLTPKHISHCESGTSSFSLPKMIQFCELCGCSMDYIIWGESKDDKIEQMPKTVLSILRTGTENDVSQLNRYLEVYCELLSSQKQ